MEDLSELDWTPLDDVDMDVVAEQLQALNEDYQSNPEIYPGWLEEGVTVQY